MILDTLSVRMRCDPARREKILTDYVWSLPQDYTAKHLWELLAMCPWGLDALLDRYLEGREISQSQPLIRKLMKVYDLFKDSKHFDSRFLEWASIPDVAPLRTIQAFADHPTRKGKRQIEELYQTVDARTRRVAERLIDGVPETVRPVWIHPHLETAPFADFEDRREAYGASTAALKLTLGWVVVKILEAPSGPPLGNRTQLARDVHAHPAWAGVHANIAQFLRIERPKAPTHFYEFR